MQPLARLAAFAAGLALIGGGAAAIGSVTKFSPPTGSGDGHGTGAMEMGRMSAGAMEMAGVAPMALGADGTRLSVDGMTLVPLSDRAIVGRTITWRFRILDREGMPVRKFERDQTKLLHLIVVRSDLTGYQHLHPNLAGDGTFSVALRLEQPGRYRAIADFTTGHVRYVLGTTIIVPGAATEVPLAPETTTATSDGYQVSLEPPAKLTAGREGLMTFVITRNGLPVRSLQAYLGAYGHLVALHPPDLAYSHVHPTGEDLSRGAITFHVQLPQAGAYRLFLQFRSHGKIHTAAFTQNVTT